MKYLFVILSFVFIATASGQLTTVIQWQPYERVDVGDTIHYHPNRKLVWKDFQGVPDNNNIAAAITASGFGYTLSVQTRNNKSAIVISVMCFFTKTKSWVKPNMNSDYALLHEQHHFDITYIGTRLFMQKLKAARFTMDNYAALLEKINNESYAEMEKMQNEYDGQTKNGRLRNIQFAWNKKIDEYLAELATD